MCRFHGARAGAPKGEGNGAYRNGTWTGDAITLRKSAAKLIKRVAKPIDIETIRAKRERGESYTRDEAQALMAYVKATLKAKRGTRAERKAANKAAWAAGDRKRWKKV